MSTDEALLDFYPTGRGHVRDRAGRARHARRRRPRHRLGERARGRVRRAPPTMVDLNAFALLRGIARGEHAQRTVALVDIGARVTDVASWRTGSPQFVRTLPNGGQDATDVIARAMNVSGAPRPRRLKRQIGIGFAVPPRAAGRLRGALGPWSAHLVEAVRNTFVYYATNNPGAGIDVVVLTGGGSHLPGLGQYLSSASRLPVALGNPLEAVDVARTAGGREAFAGHESLMALSMGLAYGVAA